MIAGAFRGRRLRSADAPGLRPTADRVREALFSILGPAVREARVLDLYAGTGALALEAISRGARSATCVENDPRAIAALEANVAALGVADRVRVVRGDALAFARARGAAGDAFDVVFCDPPYAAPLADLVDAVVAAPWWTAVCAVEHAANRPPETPPGLVADTRRWGTTGMTLFTRAA